LGSSLQYDLNTADTGDPDYDIYSYSDNGELPVPGIPGIIITVNKLWLGEPYRITELISGEYTQK
jgi:hypothetical protein